MFEATLGSHDLAADSEPEVVIVGLALQLFHQLQFLICRCQFGTFRGLLLLAWV